MKYQDFAAASERAKTRCLNESRDYIELLKEEILNPSVINEKSSSGGTDFSEYFEDLFSYIKLMTRYPIALENYKQTEYDGKMQVMKMQNDWDENKIKAEERLDAVLDAQLDRIEGPGAREKKAALRQKTEDKKRQLKITLNTRITNKIKAVEVRAKYDTDRAKAELDNLVSDNDISDDYLSKAWDESKARIDMESELSFIDKMAELTEMMQKTKLSPEQLEKKRQEADKKKTKVTKDFQAKLSKLSKEAAQAKADRAAEYDKADPDVKETLKTIMDIQQGFQDYITYGQTVLSLMKQDAETEDSNESLNAELDKLQINEDGEIVLSSWWSLDESAEDDQLKDAKEKMADTQKEITAAIDSLSVNKLMKATNRDEDGAKSFLSGIKDQWLEIRNKFKSLKNDIVDSEEEADRLANQAEVDVPSKDSKDTKVEKDDKEALQDELKAAKNELESKAANNELSKEDKERLEKVISDTQEKLNKLNQSSETPNENSSNLEYEIMTLRLRFNQTMFENGIFI